MNNYEDKNIFELMEVPTDELKEITMEEFAKEINNKKVNIHTSTDSGDIVIGGIRSHIFVREYSDGYRVSMWSDSTGYSHLIFEFSENIIFGIYSYENNKNYRIAFEGNSPDLLITVYDITRNDKRALKRDIYSIITNYKYSDFDEKSDMIGELKELIKEMED